MFKTLILATALLTGCESPTKTEPRIVKVFQDMPSLQNNPLNQGNCTWETIETSIFNQKDQKIKFDYLRCSNDEEFRLIVKNGNEIFFEGAAEAIHMFSIWKTAPHTDKEFVESLVAETARDKCLIIQDKNNNWKIGINELDKSIEKGLVMYPPLSNSNDNGICGPYSFSPLNYWVIGVKGGIGIAYSELMNSIAFYDLNSITYESRG